MDSNSIQQFLFDSPEMVDEGCQATQEKGSLSINGHNLSVDG